MFPMNFGEELAYWYLRLNGFFPLTNFVYHKSEWAEYSGDCDVLAYRPVGVWEEIGGQEVDWHPRLQEIVDFATPAVVICEVKTGTYERESLFPYDRVAYAMRRAGLAIPTDADWNESASFDSGLSKTYKLLMTRTDAESSRWHTIQIDECVAFLRKRFATYPEKFRDRVYFQSSLIQFLAYESDLARREEPTHARGRRAARMPAADPEGSGGGRRQ
jgi:hypothetical protein